jgi:ornithine carbamoyltransferase
MEKRRRWCPFSRVSAGQPHPSTRCSAATRDAGIAGPEVDVRHLLSIADLSTDQVWRLLHLAGDLKEEWKAGGNTPLLPGKSLALLFQRPSLRTRVSFDLAMSALGGRTVYLSPEEVQLGQRESVQDVGRVLSRYVDAVVARLRHHGELEELAASASVPVINGLSNYVHPCEILGDLFTIYEKRGRLQGLKLAYVGDGNNIAHSLILGAGRVGMEIRVATPEGYEPHPEIVREAQQSAGETGASVTVVRDPQQAVRDAEIIYTDVWASMGQEGEREERLHTFRPYQVNTELVALADPKVLVMHCLPAHRGEEITGEVLDGPLSIVHDQAENKLHMHKAMLVWAMWDGGSLPTGGAREVHRG